MQSFVDWMDKSGFYAKDVWDFETNKWIVGANNKMMLSEEQRVIFSHSLTCNEESIFPYTTIVWSAPKKAGKTAIAAAICAWYAECAPAGVEVYIIANDLEQAEGRVMKDVKYHFRTKNILHGDEEEKAKILAYRIELPSGTTIQALSQSYATSAGSRHSLTLFDELWGFSSEASHRMWDEMTPIPTVQNSLRVITTYAGFIDESDLLWEVYLNGVGIDEHDEGKGQIIEELKDYPCWKNGRQFTYWSHEPVMPWQSQEYYDEQVTSLRPAAYLRLHENRWVTTHETFIPTHWLERAISKELLGPVNLFPDHPYANHKAYVGVDAAPKRDCSAIVGVTYDMTRHKLIVMFHKIWTPRSDEDFDMGDTLEAYLLEMHRKHWIAQIGYDPTQLHQIMMNLKKKGINTSEYIQTANNMIKASQSLFDALKFQSLELYNDDELKSHILNAVAQDEGRGFRIVRDKRHKSKRRTQRDPFKPMDGAIALAIACRLAIDNMGTDITTPIVIESPFADMSGWKPVLAGEEALPWMFRS
jgi:phage terminase large subunit-like protein